MIFRIIYGLYWVYIYYNWWLFFCLFLYKKIGFHVKSRFDFVSALGYESRIDNIVLENKKDKSVCIYGLYAVVDDRYF